MSTNFVDAKEPSKKDKDEYEEVERELYIIPLEKFENDDVEIVEGEITKESDTLYSMSLTATNAKQDIEDNANKDNAKKSTLDKIQTGLDIAGFVPAFGAIPDVANGIIYLFRGDYANMSMSFVAAIPGYGDAVAGVAKGAKYAAKASKYVKTSKLARIESNHVTEQAMFIIRMAKGQQTKNVSLLWTNGTKLNAKKVVERVQSLAPELNIRMLETTSRGMRMESIVNKELVKFAQKETRMTQHEIQKALEDGTLWGKLEKNPKFTTKIDGKNYSLKERLENFQKHVSENYAKKTLASPQKPSSDIIVEFYDRNAQSVWNQRHNSIGKQLKDRTFIPGPNNKAEINILRKGRKIEGKRSIDGIIGVDPIK